MKILFVTQFSEIGGSSRINALQFLPYLRREGFEVKNIFIYPDSFYRIQMNVTTTSKLQKNLNLLLNLFLSNLKKTYITLISYRYDIVYIQRETFPKFLFWILLNISKKVIYQIEDPIYEVAPFMKRSWIHEKLLNYQVNLCKNMMRKSYLVITENEYLAIEARKHNKNTSIVASSIDTEMFKPANIAEKDKVVIGWIGSPSTTSYIEPIIPDLFQTVKENQNCVLKFVGSSSDFTINGISLVKKDWNLAEELVDLQSFDIGIMPFIDAPWTRGHLGGKMIQYISVGIPVVASNVGLNSTVVKDGFNGFLVNNNREWVEKLTLLIRDADLRKKLGINGRKMAEEKFSISKQARVLINLFKKVNNG